MNVVQSRVNRQGGSCAFMSLWSIPSGKVYRYNILSKVDTQWACAEAYSSCSTHLLWLRGVPLLQSQGPCGSLSLSDLYWITRKTKTWDMKVSPLPILILSLTLHRTYRYTLSGSDPDCQASLHVQSHTERCLYHPLTAAHCQLWETSRVSDPPR